MSIDRSEGKETPIIKTIKPIRLESGTHHAAFNAGGLRQEISILNNTHSVLYVKNQGNVPYAVAPIRDRVNTPHPKAHVEIRITTSLHNCHDFKATLNLANKIVNEKVATSFEAKALFGKLNDVIEAEPIASRHNNVSTMHSFLVNENDINREGYVYIRECNLLLSFREDIVFEHHPYSNEAWTAPDIRSYAESRQASGNFIRVIDNDNIRDHWYYYSAKSLVEVRSVQDPTKETGVYFSSLSYENGVNLVKTEFMTFQEAEHRLGLYATKEAALTNGNPEQLLSVEEARYKAEYERTRKELEDMKTVLERERLEHEQHRSRLAAELEHAKFNASIRKEKIDMRSEERKEQYEDRSLKRKDKADKKEKKRKHKLEKANATVKSIELAAKIAPIAIGVASFAIGYLVSRGSQSDNGQRSFTIDSDDYQKVVDINHRDVLPNVSVPRRENQSRVTIDRKTGKRYNSCGVNCV